MAELAQRLRLYLADTLAGNIELAANFFKGAGLAVIQTKAQAQYLFLAGGESPAPPSAAL